MNLKKLERYLRVNMLGPGPRLIKKKLPGRGLTKVENTGRDDLWCPPAPGLPTQIKTVTVSHSGRHRWLPAPKSLLSSADFLIGAMNGDLAADWRENSAIGRDVSHRNLYIVFCVARAENLQAVNVCVTGRLLLRHQILQLTLGFMILFSCVTSVVLFSKSVPV